MVEPSSRYSKGGISDDGRMPSECEPDIFSETVDNVLAMVEARSAGRFQSTASFDASVGTKMGSNGVARASNSLEQSDNFSGGLLSSAEIEQLQLLCSIASLESPAVAYGRSGKNPSAKAGFGHVDGDSLLKLVSLLERHVTSASNADLIRETHEVLGDGGIQEWLKQELPERTKVVRQGMEAGSILLAIMTSSDVDRRVVSEDGIESCIELMRHHLMKNVVPAITNTGHLNGGSTSSESVKPSPPSAKKQKKIRSTPDKLEKDATQALKKVYRPIVQSLGVLALLIERIEVLVRHVQLDDRPILTLCSGVLSAFEMDPIAANVSSCHLLQVASVELLTTVFRKYPKRRTVIIEDLFPLMLKLPTSKRSIRTYPVRSAVEVPLQGGDAAQPKSPIHRMEQRFVQAFSILIVSLVQSCVAMPTVQMRNDLEGKSDSGTDSHLPPKLTLGVQQCHSVSKIFAANLLQRCSCKSGDGGASEFRPIVSNLVDDLLILQLSPEFPAAETLLLSLCQILSKDLLAAGTTKINGPVTEATYLATALDALGKTCSAMARHRAVHKANPLTIPSANDGSGVDEPNDKEVIGCFCGRDARVGAIKVDCDRCHAWFHLACLGIAPDAIPETWVCDSCKLKDVVLEQTQTSMSRSRRKSSGSPKSSRRSDNTDTSAIDEKHVFRQLLLNYLSEFSQATKSWSIVSSRHFHISKWANELDDLRHSEDSNGDTDPGRLCHHFLAQWDGVDEVLTESRRNEENQSLPYLSEEGNYRLMLALLATSSNMTVAFPRMLGVMVSLMVSPLVSLRKQSVKALSLVIESDPSIMLQSALQKAVSKRFVDDATSVREAVVSLVGTYILRTPALANAFHSPLLSSLSDTGVSVRKRAVRIFRDILLSVPSYNGRAAACAAMLQRAADPKEDDVVRDLIHALFHQLWLEGGGNPVSQTSGTQTSEPPPNDSVPPIPTNGDTIVGPPGVGIVTPPEVEAPKKTRTVQRRSQVQLRCDIAAQQMVEVVRSAGSGDILTVLMKELLSGFSDADKDRKASERRKRQQAAQKHCSYLAEALMEQLLSLEESRSTFGDRSGDKLVAILRTIEVFAQASPTVALKHIDTILPYLKADNDVAPKDEAAIVTAACNIISHLTPTMTEREVRQISRGSIGDDLVQITYRFGVGPLTSAVQALASLAYHRDAEPEGFLQKKLMKLASTFYEYLYTRRDAEGDFSSSPAKTRNNVHRSLTVLGSVCRNLDGEETDQDWNSDSMQIDDIDPNVLSSTNVADACYSLFTKYLEKHDAETKCAALHAMGGIFASRPRVMLAVEQAGVIGQVMREDASPELQLEALHCWRDILVTEEKRVETGEARAKMDAKGRGTVSRRISGDQDGDSTLVGGVLAKHTTRLFQMTSSSNDRVRIATVELLGDLLRQGLINPMETVPYLFALQGDIKSPTIRSLSLKLLIREGEKRPDMLRQRACAGVMQAYEFQRLVYGGSTEACAVVRQKQGSSVQIESIFASVFKECIRSSRKQREGLYRSLLGLFDPEERVTDSKHKNQGLYHHTQKLPLLSFAAQVLAHLPYNRANDPLFIIYHISCSDALHGAQLIDKFAAFLRPHGLSSSDEHDENNTDEDALELASKSKHPSRTKEASPLNDSNFDLPRFAELCAEAYSIVLLLKLKSFLRKVYSLSETRCLEFVPNGKERIVDKGISLPEKMPLFESSFKHESSPRKKATINKDTLIRQYAEFRLLMRSETSSDHKSDGSEDETGKLMRKRGRKRSTSEVASEEDSD